MNKLINNVIFVVDRSGSMHHHTASVRKVLKETISTIGNISGQETEISYYQFDDVIERVFLKTNPRTISEVPYNARGMTAMRDAILEAITDHEEKKKSKVDRSFLMYVITDGQDNKSRSSIAQLADKISKLDDSWTICALVPSQQDAHYTKMSGIPAGNIQVWDVASEKGFEEVGRTVASSYASYSTMRSQGVRSSAALFKIDASNIKTADVKQNLTEIAGSLFHAQKDYVIKDLAEKVTNKPYVKGTVFYELTKKEIIQAQKEIVIISRKTDKRYGGKSARDLLGLPDYEVKVAPENFGDWRIFVQSTSLNRKIVPGQSIFVKM